MRDRPTSNEHYELESSRLGAASRLDNSKITEMRQYHFSDLLFLVETKNCWNVLVDLQEWLDYEKVFTVNSIGVSGGLALFWKKSVRVNVIMSDKNMIDCLVNFGEFSFFLSCIYVEHATDGGSVVWEKLSRLGCGRKEPWCMVGDFNALRNNGEKYGGPTRPLSLFQPFADMLKTYSMEELGSRGKKFTWGGMRWKKWIQCCLDRGFANESWSKIFPGSNQRFLEKRGSDHGPVFVSLRASSESFKGRFCFDKRYLLHTEVKPEVKLAWRRRQHNSGISDKIKDCRRVLSQWKKKRIFNAKDKIHILQDRLEWFQSKPYPCLFAINNTKK